MRELLALGLGLLGCAFAPAAQATAEAPRRPNILLLVADDLGYEALGCNGALDLETPAIDRLAADGLRFTHAYATPTCTPSRVQLMTGRYGHRNYVGFGILDPGELTFANLLRDAGYRTLIAGKWQLGGGGAAAIEGFGFDRHCLWNLHDYTRGKEPAPDVPATVRNRYEAPTLLVDGRWIEYGPEDYGPTICADFVERFLREESEAPFFAYHAMLLPHLPDRRQRAAAGSERSRAEFQRMVAEIDAHVGRFVRALREVGRLENTLILFTGDNGTHGSIETRTEGGPVRGAKNAFTDGGTHVPLVVHWPAGLRRPASTPGATDARPWVSDALVDLSDLLPTFVELAGGTLPTDRAIDGRSLVPILTGAARETRDFAFCGAWARGRHREGRRAFARDRRFKLYASGELYDLASDPREASPFDAGEEPLEAANARQRLRPVFEELGWR